MVKTAKDTIELVGMTQTSEGLEVQLKSVKRATLAAPGVAMRATEFAAKNIPTPAISGDRHRVITPLDENGEVITFDPKTQTMSGTPVAHTCTFLFRQSGSL